MKTLYNHLILTLFSLLPTSFAWSAIPYWQTPFSIYSSPDKLAVPQASNDRFEKLQYVLEALGLSGEASFANHYEISLFDGAQTKESFEKLLKIIDPNENLKRYASWDNSGLQVYQDRDIKKVLDFSIRFNTANSNKSYDPHNLSAIRKEARFLINNPTPLQGYRIALDPGHMGSEKCGTGWDTVTGKYVSVGGRCLSEGMMALQVALILGSELEKLGAQVLLTRDSTTPVSELQIENFPLDSFISNEIYQDTDTPWFDLLLSKYKKDKSLSNAFTTNPEIKKITNGSLRSYYYIFMEDLSARSRKINAFAPHMTLVLHFDAAFHDKLQHNANAIRAFVAGNIKGQEITSREQRASIVRTLLDKKRFEESVAFSKQITQTLSDAILVPLKNDKLDYQGIRVEDGVYARNLALTRQITQGVLSYLELLYYDYETENQKLTQRDKTDTLSLNGKTYKLQYSSRISEIAHGLKQGILNYVYGPVSKSNLEE